MDVGLVIEKAIRTLLLTLCQLVYSMIVFFYNIFEKIGTASIINDSFVMEVYERVGLILGIFMLFRITFSAIQYVINPDLLMDKKTGVGNIVKKSFIVIALLGCTPYLFQFAFKVQNYIVDANVIPKILVGAEADTNDFGIDLAKYTFFSFYTINPAASENACGESQYNAMKRTFENSGSLSMTKNCVDLYDETNQAWAINFDFHGLLPLIVGCLILWMIVMYTLQVAVRAFQLAYLQLIAPVPIMLYLDPKKDEQLQKWFKQCTTTYLDFFIRIAVIYFVIFVIEIIMSENFFNTIDVSGGFFSNFYVTVVLIIALLVFAKKVPDLFKELFPMAGGAAKFDFGLSPKKALNDTWAAGLIGGAVGGVGAMASNAVHGYMNMKNAWNKKPVDKKWSDLTLEEKKDLRAKGIDVNAYNRRRRDQMMSRFGAVAGATGKTGLSMVGGAVGGARAGLKTKDITKAGEAVKTANKNRENRELKADAGYHWYNPLPVMGEKVMEFAGESGDTIKNRNQAIRDIKQRESNLKQGELLFNTYADKNGKLDYNRAFKNDGYKVSFKELSDAKGAAKDAEIALSNAQANLNAAYTYTGDDKQTVVANAQKVYNDAYSDAKSTQGKLELAKAKHDSNKKIYADDAKVEELFKLYSDLKPADKTSTNRTVQSINNEPVVSDAELQELIKQIDAQEDKVSEVNFDFSKAMGEKPHTDEVKQKQTELNEEREKLRQLEEKKEVLEQSQGTGTSFMDVSMSADTDERSKISKMSKGELGKYAKSLEKRRSELEKKYNKLADDQNNNIKIDTAEFSKIKKEEQDLGKEIERVRSAIDNWSLDH